MLEVVTEDSLVATDTKKIPIKTKIGGKIESMLELPIIAILSCL